MTKQKKYIDFIVNNLIKNTELVEIKDSPIDHYRLPNGLKFLGYQLEEFSFNDLREYASTKFFDFSDYLINKYGSRSDDIETIWDIYRERVVKVRDSLPVFKPKYGI